MENKKSKLFYTGWDSRRSQSFQMVIPADIAAALKKIDDAVAAGWNQTDDTRVFVIDSIGGRQS